MSEEVVKADPDDTSEVVHHAPVIKDEVRVVSGQVCCRNLHLSLFEYELDHGVHQKVIPLLMQTTAEERHVTGSETNHIQDL